VYTFVVAASLSSTYPQVRLRRLLAAASVSPRIQIGIISQCACHHFIFLKLNCKAFGYIFNR
jgi:hypothetical protein